jgi:hypothetical protein
MGGKEQLSGCNHPDIQKPEAGTEIARAGEILYNHDCMVVPIEKFEEPNSRIEGLRKLARVGAPIASPTFVIPHKVFLAYKENPEQALAQLEKELALPAQQVMAKSKKHSIALRRAYEVPGLANPPGPRYLGVTDKTITGCVKELFDFAIQESYDVEGAQIACFFYPFIDPENKPLENVQRNDVLPYGGHIIVDPANPNKFQILATWGNHETLMFYERQGKPVETYSLIVDPAKPERIIIYKKDIVQKDEMHYTDKRGKNEIVPVPKSHQLLQVMWDSEIIEIAKHTIRLVQEYGPQRAEFTFDGENFFFNESVDMEKEVKVVIPDYSAQGKILVVKSRKDIERLASLTEKERENSIIYATDEETGRNTYVELAKRFKDTPLTILYAGTSRTAHIMRVFQDKGHFPVAIGRQDLREGDMVSVSSKNGLVDFENLTISAIPEITPLNLAYKRTIEQVGGKAERLSYLQLKGFSVPDGAVLTADFFDQVLKANGADKLLEKLILEHAPVNKLSHSMQQQIRKIPNSLWKNVLGILRRYNLLSNDREIISRSSANVEDLRGESYAGVFESCPFLKGEESVREGILKCIRSVFTPRVLANIGEENLEELLGIKMPVLVQAMIDARVSGTLFGKDPQSRSEKIITIEAKKGFGQEIVEGYGTEQRLVFIKADRKCALEEGEQVLSDAEVEFLLDLSSLLESRFRFPQDIEWSIDTKNKFWILQSRDL